MCIQVFCVEEINEALTYEYNHMMTLGKPKLAYGVSASILSLQLRFQGHSDE